MNYEASKPLSPQKFKRRFGVQRPTFKRMVNGLKAMLPKQPGPGRP
ncbi:MAG: IS5/IS1182 family transposase, partial [Cyanobacteria bacterium J06649_12]